MSSGLVLAASLVFADPAGLEIRPVASNVDPQRHRVTEERLAGAGFRIDADADGALGPVDVPPLAAAERDPPRAPIGRPVATSPPTTSPPTTSPVPPPRSPLPTTIPSTTTSPPTTVPSTTVPPTTVPIAVIETQPPSSPIEQRFIDLIHQARADEGLAPMVVDVDVTTVARNWSTELSHSGECPAGLRHNPRYIDQMPPGWSGVAENIGCGRSVDIIHQGFMNSSGHRDNILNGTFNRLGVGVEVAPDGTLWVTQNFGRY